MKIHASGEDYLEAILVLQKKMGMVRSIDLARHMGFSKPSISHAYSYLQEHEMRVDDRRSHSGRFCFPLSFYQKASI
jgi:Mn-dependent DtxR family transcriptional regulator